jgi:peptidoglycan/LPS O-acetylase OafA/YrhL
MTKKRICHCEGSAAIHVFAASAVEHHALQPCRHEKYTVQKPSLYVMCNSTEIMTRIGSSSYMASAISYQKDSLSELSHLYKILTVALSKYRPDIDGLRAVAVLAVVLHHLSAPLVPGGYVGVDVFFVISGYLITSIISREMAEGQFTFARFYERRARRIFPALFAVLAVTLAAGWFLLLPSDYASTLRAALGTLFFSSNLVFWREMQAGYFAATDAKLNPLLHTWSLAVEEQFYVFFPILLLVCYRYCRKYIFWILLGCALVSLGAALLLVKSKVVAVFFLSPFRAWELLAGSMLAFGYVPSVRSRLLREALVGGGLLAVLAACFLYDDKTTFPGLAALLPVMGTAAIIHAGTSDSTLAGRLLQWRPVAYIGLISYSLYLWHWPLIVLFQFVIGMDPLTLYLPVLFVASLLLGSLSYHFIEQPFRRGSRVATRRIVFSSTAVFASLLTVVAVAGLVKSGFAGRFDATVVKLDKARAPSIPYIECEGRAPQAWCTLGRPEGELKTLLWGDSHMLAWAPALHQSLSNQNRLAIFAPSSACPPMFGVESSIKRECTNDNQAIQNYLLTHPEIKTVVIAAYWSTYFREDGPLSANRQGGDRMSVKGTAAAQQALAATVQWLRDHDRQVILIGPVPAYSKSVPLVLALESATGRSMLHSSASAQRNKHAPFFKVVDAVPAGPSFRFLNPIQWLCNEDCKVIKDGVPLYRDSHYMSVAGVMALEIDLANGLAFATTERGNMARVAAAAKQ